MDNMVFLSLLLFFMTLLLPNLCYVLNFDFTNFFIFSDSGIMILDFWCPTENMERLPQRQVSLYKFVRLAGDLLMPSLYTPYVKLLGKKI